MLSRCLAVPAILWSFERFFRILGQCLVHASILCTRSGAERSAGAELMEINRNTCVAQRSTLRSSGGTLALNVRVCCPETNALEFRWNSGAERSRALPRDQHFGVSGKLWPQHSRVLQRGQQFGVRVLKDASILWNSGAQPSRVLPFGQNGYRYDGIGFFRSLPFHNRRLFPRFRKFVTYFE